MRRPGKEPTPRQQQVIDFICEYSAASNGAPTVREICNRFGFKSTNAARQHLRLIEQKGYLKRVPHSARGLRAFGGNTRRGEIVRVPLVGRIAAGTPIVAIEDIEAEIPLPRAYYRGRDLFALRVRGDSMSEAGINDGDIAIIEKQPRSENGQIAAVVLDNDATLKRVFRSATSIRLHAENRNYPDQIFGSDDFASVFVAGVLVGILRSV
jgi:repressor LexA